MQLVDKKEDKSEYSMEWNNWRSVKGVSVVRPCGGQTLRLENQRLFSCICPMYQACFIAMYAHSTAPALTDRKFCTLRPTIVNGSRWWAPPFAMPLRWWPPDLCRPPLRRRTSVILIPCLPRLPHWPVTSCNSGRCSSCGLLSLIALQHSMFESHTDLSPLVPVML